MLLLGKGANVNLQDACGRTALSYACEMRCNDLVRILVQNNVDPDIADDKGTPRHTVRTLITRSGCGSRIKSGRQCINSTSEIAADRFASSRSYPHNYLGLLSEDGPYLG